MTTTVAKGHISFYCVIIVNDFSSYSSTVVGEDYTKDVPGTSTIQVLIIIETTTTMLSYYGRTLDEKRVEH